MTLDDRIHERDDAAHRQQDAGQVKPSVPSRRLGARQQPTPGEDRGQTERHVDQEDCAPAGAKQVQ